jgi:hypothetical protein
VQAAARSVHGSLDQTVQPLQPVTIAPREKGWTHHPLASVGPSRLHTVVAIAPLTLARSIDGSTRSSKGGIEFGHSGIGSLTALPSTSRPTPVISVHPSRRGHVRGKRALPLLSLEPPLFAGGYSSGGKAEKRRRWWCAHVCRMCRPWSRVTPEDYIDLHMYMTGQHALYINKSDIPHMMVLGY